MTIRNEKQKAINKEFKEMKKALDIISKAISDFDTKDITPIQAMNKVGNAYATYEAKWFIEDWE